MKKEMKKILATALTCAMSISLLAGCGGGSNSGSGESADAPATEETDNRGGRRTGCGSARRIGSGG